MRNGLMAAGALALAGLLAWLPASPAAAQVIANPILCPDGRHATDPSQCPPVPGSGPIGGASSSSMSTLSSGGDESASIASMYATRLKASQEITAGGDAPFGETISLYTGELNLRQTDVRVSGTGPDIVLSRFNSYLGAWLGTLPLPFGNWNGSIPRIELLVGTPTVNNQGTVGGNWTANGTGQRCTQFLYTDASWQTWWAGIQFIDENGGAHEMMARASGNTAQPTISVGGSTLAFPIVTQDNWQVGCLPATSNGQAGEAFLAVSPDGTKYWFDYAVGDPAVEFSEPDPDGGPPLRFGRMLARMYVTRIEDRFGNYLTYSYSGDKLSAITASDGRQVTVAWRTDGRRINTVSVVGATTRTWTYGYDTGGKLTGVTLPDSSTWTFNNVPIQGGASLYGESTLGVPWTECGVNGPMKTYPTQSVGTIKNPAGLTGTFTTQLVFHARSYVPSVCLQFGANPSYEGVPSTFGSTALVSRAISGPGVPTASWTYAYSAATGSHTRDACAGTSSCPETATTTIISPEGHRTVLTYSTRWGAKEGKLLTEQAYQGTSTLLRTTTYDYADPGHGPYPAQVGVAMINGTSTANVATQQTWTPTILRSINQQGVTFSHTVAPAGLDAFAHEIDATDAGTSTRQVVTTYHDNTAPWILGQVATRTVAGVQAERTDYDSADRPWKTYAFGKLRQTLTYNANGTLATAKDGNNNVTTFTSWKRGIPQSIQFPATPEAPAGATRTAVVDNNGWITSVTDENGYTTGYGYDTMGRLASIAYPTGDSTTWNGTTIAFVPVASAEYGIAAGHWRQTVSTGNARKVTYYNAQWQPVLVREYDTGNVAGTDRYTASAYDKLGRVWRSAYPVAAAPAMTAAADWSLSGTRTTYDALGRPTSVVQDAESPYGTLTTSTSYGTGFKTTVTNARSKVTTSTFQAWDQPVTDFPKAITLPEGAYVDIVRDAFGKPTSITRRNSSGSLTSTRTYAYNGNQELCRVVEPELGATEAGGGATLMGYDGAGNLSWSASGLDKGSACSSTGNTTAINARKAARTYDGRNRVGTLTFPDGNGNQSWTYFPDGLVKDVTTWNDGGTTSVVNSYAYNKRRLPTSESQNDGTLRTVGYAYTANGHLSTLTYPDSLSVAYAPNALGQPTQAGTYATGVSYFPNGALKQFTYGNGIVHTLTQNTRGLPDRSRDADGTTSIHDDSYAYDQVGNVLAISDGVAGARGDRDMTYDGLDRLTDATSPMYGASGAHYTYDVLDNVTRIIAPGRDQAYCYDVSWRLTNVKVSGDCSTGSTILGTGFDVQGNLANWNGVAYTFDYGNRLRAIAGLEAYRYDAWGRRTRSSSTAGLVESLYGRDGQLLYQRDARTSRRRQYVYLAGSLVAEHDRPLSGSTVTVTYQHTDALGSPVATTDAARAVLQRSEYEPYGKLLNRPMEDGPAYTGHVSDAATSLVYMQQRYYDPRTARFWSVDPVTVDSAGGNFNRYWYANDNPYRFTDPDGRQSYEDLNFSGQVADQLLRNGEISKEEHLDMWASGAISGGQGVLLGMAIADGALLSRGGASRLLSWRGTQSAAREFSVDSAQLGHKLGAHVKDFGGHPGSAVDRAAVTKLIYEIGQKPSKVAFGVWRGLGSEGKLGPAEFRIKGSDVVVTTLKGEFVTILQDGIKNKFVQAAINATK